MWFEANSLNKFLKLSVLSILVLTIYSQTINWVLGVEPGFSGNSDKVLRNLAEGTPTLDLPSTELGVDQVKAIQKRLNELGYNASEIDGKPNPKFKHALIAFQKMNGLNRDGEVSPQVLETLKNPVQPKPSQMHNGIHTEADLERQVLTVYLDNNILRILPISSGTGKPFKEPHSRAISIAKTPTGNFKFFAHIWGVDKGHLGDLYNPVFFHEGGFAVHGDSLVPPYPASHGCIRITIYDSVWFEKTVPLGSPIFVSETALPTDRQQ